MAADDAELYTRHFRRHAAAGAMGVVSWDAARAEIRRTVKDVSRVKDRRVHRFVHEDGRGYTGTNDEDGAKVVWLFKDATQPDGRTGKAGEMVVIE